GCAACEARTYDSRLCIWPRRGNRGHRDRTGKNGHTAETIWLFVDSTRCVIASTSHEDVLRGSQSCSTSQAQVAQVAECDSFALAAHRRHDLPVSTEMPTRAKENVSGSVFPCDIERAEVLGALF